MNTYWGIQLIGIGIALLGAFVSNRLKAKFQQYSTTYLANGLTGKEVAERMLQRHGIRDVKVISVPGVLSDHYNPAQKTVNLSQSVFNQRNAAAAAVAAHECGHAVQHATGYPWLRFRSAMVPLVNISSKVVMWVLIAGIVMVQSFPGLLLIGIILFALTTVFSVITLPVEYDASARALKWLKEDKIVTPEEYDTSKDALKWAGLTYVVAAIGSLTTLLYYLSIYLRRRR
ncbi:MAG: hypothetical protein RL226_2 [Bacteroidota bacterium]|jgi:Zn-dependent membrane protease YugP